MIVVILLVIYILSVIGMWKVFRKAGCLGWVSIIPIINTFVLCKIAWGRYAWAWLWIIPIVNIVIGIMTYNRLSKSFGHGAGYTVGLIFLPLIFFIMLGFGSEQYLGPNGRDANRSNGAAGGYNNGYNNQAGGYNNGYNSAAGGYNNNGYNNQAGGYNNGPNSQAGGYNNGPNSQASGYNDGSNAQTGSTVQFCPHCGQQIPADASFCKYCGSKV